MQNHYQKKIVTKIAKFISNEFTLFATFSTLSFISFSTFSIILFIFIEFALFATFFAIFKKQIFWVKIISKFITSKSSRLSFSILEFLKNVSISLFIFSFIFSQKLISNKTYLTMNNLFVIFVEKSKSLNLSYRQKSKLFSYHWQLNKFVIFISHQTRITSYFLSSFNSFKFNILSKSNFCLFIQANVLRRHIFFCEQIINFASRNASI